MSGEIRTIARALRSASHNTLPNGDLAFLELQGRRLVEKIYDGEELKDQRMVATGLREGSTAAYAVAKDRVFAVYISDDGLIRVSEFDEDSEEWDDAEVEGLGDIAVHDQSHITVAGLPSMNLVLYQAPDGTIKTIMHDKDSDRWTEEFNIPGSAATGTPIAGFSTDEALVVSFFGQDNEIHAHTRDFESGDWTDKTIPDSSFDDTVDSLIVAKDKDSGNFEAYVLSNNTVYNITKTGSRETVGSFSRDGDFVPSTKAESGGCYSNNWVTKPLPLCASNMADNIFVDARKGSLTSTKLEAYLASGVDINAQDPKTGFTPLGMAAKYGRLSVVNLLLDKNASPRAMSKPGMTPLYIAANGNGDRVNIVRKLLEKGAQVDEISAEVDNDTPLMVAITHARDPVVVNMLIDAGASLQAKNSKNETAKELAEQSGNPAIQRAVSPPGQQMAGLPELINALVNFVLFILAYVNSGVINGVVKGVVSNLYHIGQPPPDQTLAQDLDNPTTIDDFQKGVEKYVQDSDLGQFFAPGNDYLQKVAEKAIELKDDPRNHLKEPEQMKGLVKLALYQPIFYCDDSGSMQANILDPNGNVVSTRMEAMRSLVQRMSSIATRLVPDGSGAHLRFINSDYQGDDLTADQIDSHMQFQPMGGTNIGTNLKKKVLEPLVFKKLDKDGKLDRPFLVLTITDGEPSPEPVDTFKKTIEECGRRLDQKDYPQESTMFLISQVGNDPHADKFLDSLSGDTAIDRVLFRSSERLHEKYAELRDNEGELEEWLFNILMQPITG
ncbi:Ankyrin repeat [Fusarium oxysporum f. sp. vasinfectum]|nr:Ankyrin repeat [Fusarium oxysporum f. sp. vasinfectum]